MLEITIPGSPTVWRAPYVGSRGAFSPKFHEKRIIQSLIRELYKDEIIKDPVRCDIYFHVKIPKSASKNRRLKMISNEIQPTGGGDLVNLRKMYEDCLQEIVIENDRQIVEGFTVKFFAENPRTVIQIYLIKEKD